MVVVLPASVIEDIGLRESEDKSEVPWRCRANCQNPSFSGLVGHG